MIKRLLSYLVVHYFVLKYNLNWFDALNMVAVAFSLCHKDQFKCCWLNWRVCVCVRARETTAKMISVCRTKGAHPHTNAGQSHKMHKCKPITQYHRLYCVAIVPIALELSLFRLRSFCLSARFRINSNEICSYANMLGIQFCFDSCWVSARTVCINFVNSFWYQHHSNVFPTWLRQIRIAKEQRQITQYSLLTFWVEFISKFCSLSISAFGFVGKTW